MVSFQQLFSAAAVPAIALANAPVVNDSPSGVKYIAQFKSNSSQDVTGTVEFVGAANGSTIVNVDLKGLPASGGPFPYHIHERAVPADGDCYGTGLHLNPYNGSATATSPAAKEVGDLAGKHGNIQGNSLQTSYIDDYVSLNPDDPAYPGKLSVVIHFLNNSRITCANITTESKESNSSNGTSSVPASSNAAGAGSVNAASGIFIGALVAGVSLLI